MDYMPGKPLEEVWHQLTQYQETATFKALGCYISQLKELTNNKVESKAAMGFRLLLDGVLLGNAGHLTLWLSLMTF